MSSEPQLFRVDPSNRESNQIDEVDFGKLGFSERYDIQEWVAANPGILGEKLLIIAKEFSGFDRTNERLDLLAVDEDGKLVVIELKRDDSGSDVHWQAIKYASYLSRASESAIIRMLSRYEKITPEEARDQLIEHLGADDNLNALNNDQRIILASHRFAPEVTSAVLWLNEKAPGKNLITCTKLTPHRDSDTDSLYVQASTIIPVPGAEDYMIGIGGRVEDEPRLSRSRRDRTKDDITHFMREVRRLTLRGLPDDLKPDRRSRHAGAGRHRHYGSHRYYHLWYRHAPWHNWELSYRIELFHNSTDEADSPVSSMMTKWQQLASEIWGWKPPTEENALGPYKWEAMIRLAGTSETAKPLRARIENLQVHPDQIVAHGEWGFSVEVVRGGDALNDTFASTLADTLRPFIEQITPIVDNLEDEANEEDA